MPADTRIPLELRDHAFRGYVLTVEGVVAPSGELHRHLSEAGALEMLRRVARELDPEVMAMMRRTPFDVALRNFAGAACRTPQCSELQRAVAILTWIAAEALGATWDSVDAGGDA